MRLNISLAPKQGPCAPAEQEGIVSGLNAIRPTRG